MVNKPWGNYQVVERTEKHVVKIITVAPHQALSLQSHEHRAERWHVLAGQATIQVGDVTKTYAPHQAVDIPIGVAHRLSNNTDHEVRILEVGYGERVEESDIIRLQDRYGRAAQGKTVPQMIPPVMIAEVGCNHKGDLDIAIEMIKIAAQFCKADVVKFQKRTNKELLTPEEYNAPHPNPANSYGATYGEHREFLEFDMAQNRRLMDACAEWGVVYSTSVWDMTAARQVVGLNPALIKVPSAINTNFPMIDYLASAYEGDIHVSLGMTTHEERDRIVEVFDRRGRLKSLVLYHCTSGYPVPDNELFLLELPKLVKAYGGKVKGIGFSGHHNGIAADIAALALGAEYFERHFTLDRTWKGTDHSASLEPDGLRRLTRDLKSVAEALRSKDVEISPIEVATRKKLKKVVGMDPAALKADASPAARKS